MKKNLMMAAVLAAAMCGAANASERALETLNGSTGAEIEEMIKAAPAAQSVRADEWRGGSRVYTNAEGCVVTAEQRNNGVMVYVQDGRGAQATLGFLNDYRRGDIFAFCSPALAELKGKTLTLSCGEQQNGGYPTRGAAVIEMNNGITGVSVRGEVKKAFGWKADTQISCGGLKPDYNKALGGEKSAAGLSGTYRRDDGYTSAKLTVREAQQGGAGKLEFALTAATAGGHTGEIEGIATAGKDGSFGFRGPGGCSMKIVPGQGKLTVTGADESCQDYLGMNVFVDGEYLVK